MSAVIKVENLSKQYRLGKIGTGTLSHDLNRWWHNVRGKEDPYLKVSQVNDRTQKKGTDEYVWALKDIHFEVEQGDVVGIVGKNGAGKSTLLKILSRTTLPTTGSIKVKGRIASLLEVGTGFHPELTGRENIFLNGAILGMRKAEIKTKFDEIVDFSGVEKYVDTPVKRYSSGMYVRLAFAVAAHLESEILIVDEVLAVGDTEFQQKCLGKMGEVSKGQGRTVLFVSHNMGAVKTLCDSGILLKHGTIAQMGTIQEVVQGYLDENTPVSGKLETLLSKCGRVELNTPYFTYANGTRTNEIAFGDDVFINFELNFLEEMRAMDIGFAIVKSSLDERVFTSHLKDDSSFSFPKGLKGKITFRSRINLPFLAPGLYHAVYGVHDENDRNVIYSEKNVPLEISKMRDKDAYNGILRHQTRWELLDS